MTDYPEYPTGQFSTFEEAFRAGVRAERERQAAPREGDADEGDKLTRERIGEMSPEEVNSRWDEVQQVLAGGDSQ